VNCRQCHRLIEENILADLDARSRVEVDAHLNRCKKCSVAYRKALTRDEILAVSLAEYEPVSPASQALSARLRWSARFYGMRRGLILAASAAVLFVACVLGYRWTLGFVSPVQAEPLDQSETVRGPGFEDGVLSWGGVGGWSGYQSVNDPHAPQFAMIDPTVWHDGHHPLKIFQRHFSGTVRRHFDLPLPKGTEVELGFWALAPRGGTSWNKYISASINTGHQYAATNLGVALNDWLPHSVVTTVNQRSDSLDIAFGAPGDGLYTKWDWATWIDDVEIAVIVDPRRFANWWQENGKLVSQIRLPAPYRIQDIVPGSVRLFPYSSEEFRPVPADADPALNARGIYQFSSQPGLRLLRGRNPDTGGDVATKITGRVRYGQYEVTFENGLIGHPAAQDAPPQISR